MEKQKPWQLCVIIAVLVLTLYNILPTVFFYSNPLKEPINAQRADQISLSIMDRVNQLEPDAESWLHAFAKQIGTKPSSVKLQAENPGIVEVAFTNTHDASLFRRLLPSAGSLIPFVPAQLELYSGAATDPTTVLVARQITTHLNPSEREAYFHFSSKYDESGQISNLYRDITLDRVSHLGLAFGGTSRTAIQTAAIVANQSEGQYDDLLISLAKEIAEIRKTFGTDSLITKRYFASFTQIDHPEKEALIGKLIARAEKVKDKLETEKKAFQSDKTELETIEKQQIALLVSQIQALDNATAIMKQNESAFKEGVAPLTLEGIKKSLKSDFETLSAKDPHQILPLANHHPYVKSLLLDWGSGTVELQFYPDVQAIRLQESTTESQSIVRNRLNQLVINDIARISRISDETIAPTTDTFAIALNTLNDMQSFLSFDLGHLAEKEAAQLTEQIRHSWQPEHTDLVREQFPIWTYEQYQKLSPAEQKLGLVVYAPTAQTKPLSSGFRPDSIYVIARGIEDITKKYREAPEASGREQFLIDMEQLSGILQKNGFIGYPGISFGSAAGFGKDFIFEKNDYYSALLGATREDFIVKGSKQQAILDFSNVEQRIITENKIDDRIQEDLLKWQEEYQTAQADIDPAKKFLIPPPTKSPLWQNTKLSMAKYYRGDDRKILKWGLDLSGGKTVRIGLRDHNNQVVTEPDDLKQAVNELYTRINKMGVAERTIRIENNNIILDFPGSQALSASELVKASAMYFHIMNEKFSSPNSPLRDTVNQFLQDVWNEAVVTNRKDAESINQIAWEQLGGNVDSGEESLARSEAAKILLDNGLKLASPSDQTIGNAFNDSISSIALRRGDDFAAWQGNAHPLVLVFRNYALEGSNLTNVQVGYDPSKGNLLTFSVKGSYDGKRTGSPRNDFYAWTSQFSQERIQGTPKEAYSQGRGWRMAVILNSEVISDPSLEGALRDGATITGRFSQREINQLAADLKAGSLSFTPRILSENNVSPDLGLEERRSGITASLIALALVVVAMVGYYRFAGLIASCAVLLNIFIMWGVLQNLGAAITLPGIAGIVLTIGMAVDANVLVFERIREEFAVSGRLASAIQSGYRKAFSAIIDSNITTIIAALILIQFDSGPIKGFAITLIIGILSSMFTALFLTRYFFAGWVRRTKSKALSMSHWIGDTSINFLHYAKGAVGVSVLAVVLGGALFFNQSNTIFGMDFTGGYSLNADVEESTSVSSYRSAVTQALVNQGAPAQDVQVRQLSQPNQLRIQLGMGMEEPGQPFYQLPKELTEGKFAYEYEKNPRLAWVVSALATAGIPIQPSELGSIDADWSVMSGQLSDVMRNNAMVALGCALLSILFYITIRFEFKYAISAVIALAHDVAITMGVLALFHWLGFHVQIDLEIVGAIMTIIGYSLNDTIIIFDRIREDLTIHRKLKFHEVINHALNVTLSRTLMTSGTTLLVLMALVLLGGPSIFGFSLVMTIGVLVGTLSSLFIAGPMLLYFHNREVAQQESHKKLKKA